MTQSRNSKISESNYNRDKEGKGWMQMMMGNIIILNIFSCHTLLSQIENIRRFLLGPTLDRAFLLAKNDFRTPIYDQIT